MKIGIIGGGISGLASAWLLEELHDVTLFEKQDRLGGHAYTIFVPTPSGDVPVESGFEFFNDAMFPHFTRLLEILKIPTRSYSFNYTFSSEATDEVFILPPWREGKIFWDMLSPGKIKRLLQLKYVVKKYEKFILEKDMDATVEEFLEQCRVSDSFKNDFFIPLFCAGWGVTPELFKTFSAYNLLRWMVNNKTMGLQDCTWKEIPAGVASYVAALVGQAKRAQFKTSANIKTIIYEKSLYWVIEQDGSRQPFDHIILATNAQDAHALLQDIPHLQNRRIMLDKVKYIGATIGIHGDERFMPKNKKHWSIANVWYDGKNSALTTHKPWHGSTPLFRSWLMPGFPLPEPLYATLKFQHAEITPIYFEVQKLLSELQGEYNIWTAGLYTYDIDSHENALISALKVAEHLAPESSRYRAIMKMRTKR
jgi:predicted NAD/FAD-binding protein